MVSTAVRNASLQDLAALLQTQQARKVDMVVPALKMRSVNGLIHVSGADPQITDEGVTLIDGIYRPTTVFDEGVAEKLGIPLAYVRKMREQRPDLYDANVNGWLHGSDPTEGDGTLVGVPADARKFMLRAFKADDGEIEGIGRALLSDTYKRMDNLDVLMAALDGVRQSGADVEVLGCDLTERNMRVRIAAPSVFALAPTLMSEYRQPFRDGGATRQGRTWEPRWIPQGGDGAKVGDIVFAGFVLTNSETGGGAFSITPRITALACTNGMTYSKDAVRSVHLGAKMDEGVVEWSADTERKNLALITAKARDAVASFLDADWITAKIAEVEAKAGTPVADPAETIKTLGKALSFDESTTKGILDAFILGGQMTAGGVLNAVTAHAQTVADADKAADIEDSALKAFDLVTA